MKRFLKITILILLIGMGGAFMGSHFLGKYSLNDLGMDYPNLNSSLEQPQSTNPKEFISPDGHLKLTYTSDWIEVRNEEVLQNFTPEEPTQEYRLQTLLLASRPTKGSFSSSGLLLVRKGELKDGSFKKVVDIMKETNKKEGWNMKILDSHEKEEALEMKIEYTKLEHSSYYSKEKIFLSERGGETNIYTIAIVGEQKNWQQIEPAAQEIISSAQLID